MKFRTYAVSLADQVREQTVRLHGTIRMAAVSGMTTAMIAVPTIVAHAEEVAGNGSNVLTGDVWNSVLDGFSSLVITFTAIIAVGAVAGITIASMTAGCRFAIKYIKGLLSQAG